MNSDDIDHVDLVDIEHWVLYFCDWFLLLVSNVGVSGKGNPMIESPQVPATWLVKSRTRYKPAIVMMEVDPPASASSEAVHRIRTRIELEEHSVINVRAQWLCGVVTWYSHTHSLYLQTHSSDFPSNYPGFDDAWSIKKFKKVRHWMFIILFGR